MKKLKFLIAILALFGTSFINAQAKPEKKAQKFTDEMTQVLSLNKEESDAIYKIQLGRFTESQSIEKEFADDADIKAEKLKTLGNKVYNDVKKIIGEERQKQWKEYKSKK